MQTLIVFLCGILFVGCIYPILKSIVDTILVCFEALQMKISTKIAQYQKYISDTAEQCESSTTHAIGFCAPTVEEVIEEDDE